MPFRMANLLLVLILAINIPSNWGGCQNTVESTRGKVTINPQCESLSEETLNWKRTTCSSLGNLKDYYLARKYALRCPATGSFLEMDDLTNYLKEWCDNDKEDHNLSDRNLDLSTQERLLNSDGDDDSKNKAGTSDGDSDGPVGDSDGPVGDSDGPVGDSDELERLSKGMQKAFMTVEEILKKVLDPDTSGLTFRQSESIVIYNNITQLLNDKRLGSLARKLLKTLAPKTWRTMHLVDGCCPTFKFLSQNKTMVNVNGLSRRIVHFEKMDPPKYQVIQHGICTPDANKQKGRTRLRTCAQRFLAVPLLVWDTHYNPPYTIDLFQIPSHCACFNGV